jgi:hypothetical protein
MTIPVPNSFKKRFLSALLIGTLSVLSFISASSGLGIFSRKYMNNTRGRANNRPVIKGIHCSVIPHSSISHLAAVRVKPPAKIKLIAITEPIKSVPTLPST